MLSLALCVWLAFCVARSEAYCPFFTAGGYEQERKWRWSSGTCIHIGHRLIFQYPSAYMYLPTGSWREENLPMNLLSLWFSCSHAACIDGKSIRSTALLVNVGSLVIPFLFVGIVHLCSTLCALICRQIVFLNRVHTFLLRMDTLHSAGDMCCVLFFHSPITAFAKASIQSLSRAHRSSFVPYLSFWCPST